MSQQEGHKESVEPPAAAREEAEGERETVEEELEDQGGGSDASEDA